jgi:hypothetical protein
MAFSMKFDEKEYERQVWRGTIFAAYVAGRRSYSFS